MKKFGTSSPRIVLPKAARSLTSSPRSNLPHATPLPHVAAKSSCRAKHVQIWRRRAVIPYAERSRAGELCVAVGDTT